MSTQLSLFHAMELVQLLPGKGSVLVSDTDLPSILFLLVSEGNSSFTHSPMLSFWQWHSGTSVSQDASGGSLRFNY